MVWSKVFGAWRLFVLYQKASAEKMELAAAIGKSCFKVRVETLEKLVYIKTQKPSILFFMLCSKNIELTYNCDSEMKKCLKILNIFH